MKGKVKSTSKQQICDGNSSAEKPNKSVRKSRGGSTPCSSPASASFVVTDQLDDENNVNNPTLFDIMNEMKVMSQYCVSMNDKVDTIQVQQQRRIELLEDEVKELKCEKAAMLSKIEELQLRVGAGEQEKLRDTAVISGTAGHKDEDLVALVCGMATALACEVSEQNIVHCRRFSPTPGSTPGSPSNILVKFSSPEACDRLMVKCKEAQKANNPITTEKLKMPGPLRYIFVNPMMTPDNKKLYDGARSLVKEAGYKFVWFKYDKVWVRRDEGARPVHIRSLAQIAQLSSEATTECK